ncbi:hypothetical protein AAC387_Pa04g1361 [Persea americana]
MFSKKLPKFPKFQPRIFPISMPRTDSVQQFLRGTPGAWLSFTGMPGSAMTPGCARAPTTEQVLVMQGTTGQTLNNRLVVSCPFKPFNPHTSSTPIVGDASPVLPDIQLRTWTSFH